MIKSKKPDIIGLLSDAENRMARMFILNHKCPSEKTDEFTIKIKSTGIGNSIRIKCKNCDKKLDITDIENW